MESYSPVCWIKRVLIDEFDEPSPSRKSLKTNQGGVKRISHFDDKDIVKCHYKNIKKENVKVEPDVHIKSEKEFEVNTKRNFRTRRNRKVNLTEQAPIKNINIKKEKLIEEGLRNNSCDIEQDHVKKICYFDDKDITIECRNKLIKKENIKVEVEVNTKKKKIVEENIQNNSGDIQRASNYDDNDISELFECHDVKHKLEHVKEEPEFHVKVGKEIEVEPVEVEVENNIMNKKVINEKVNYLDLLRSRNKNKKKVKKALETHRKCCKSYDSFLNCLRKFNYNEKMRRGCKRCTLCFWNSDCKMFIQEVHVNAVNHKIKNYTCGCGKKFTHKSILKMHINDTHKHLIATNPIAIFWYEKKTKTVEFIRVKTL